MLTRSGVESPQLLFHAPPRPPFNKFWRTSLHCKLDIWDCLSKTKSPHIPLIPPPSPPPFFLPPGLTKAGLFKYAHSRRWFVLAREQVPSPARRSGVSAVTLRSWVASFTLTLPHVSRYTYHPHAESFQQAQKCLKRELTFPSSLPSSSSLSSSSFCSLSSSFSSSLPNPLLLSPWSSPGTLWMSGPTSYKQQGRGSFECWGCVTLASCRWLKYGHVNKWCLKSLEYSAPLLSKEKEKMGGLCGYFSG